MSFNFWVFRVGQQWLLSLIGTCWSHLHASICLSLIGIMLRHLCSSLVFNPSMNYTCTLLDLNNLIVCLFSKNLVELYILIKVIKRNFKKLWWIGIEVVHSYCFYLFIFKINFKPTHHSRIFKLLWKFILKISLNNNSFKICL